ncbi:c-type cytochrome domain-containing protein [Maribacter antarcticus]|uniref:c-type cytochrome domain-containing protein n=1 Tax=Maribacter antarcticus TaxID=505250 RepID=UPI00047A96BB|nr:c-type cytochrome domain-containing protein [Maribacter antarcticus]
MEVLKQLLGRLHPLIVHLPIGFIILGLLLQWYDRKQKKFNKVSSLIYKWGGISAVFACITGYLQYVGEGYAFDTIKWHLWAGISTALFSFLMYSKVAGLKATEIFKKIPVIAFSIVFFILLSYTGHQGGNITHGEDYLIEPLPNNIKSALGFETFEKREIVLNEATWEEALIYEDLINPILNNTCVSCHNPKKTKGGLLLHTKEGILKGGDNEELLLAENSNISALYHRITLPMAEDEHMPPNGKTQPTKEEIKLIAAWIDAGHPFEGSIKEAGLKKQLFLSFFLTKHDYDYPDIEIAKVSKDSILAIKEIGIHVDAISKATNFLSVSAINKPSFKDSDFEGLLSLKNNISRLDLGGTQVTDALVEKLVQLPNLTVLKLDNTVITGNTIKALTSLTYLKSINLTGSHFETIHLEKLASFPKLQRVFLYSTNVNTKGVNSLKEGRIKIDYGNYELPPIPSDSIIY